ncbi:hypothetical protein [Tardiphaga sp. OK245]|uniref:hypothetical protein n=1 Tax=Tardiphaga sp. OK245 TaxID=1855306 RepID=UPI0008A75A89|nr:hypothetical protein [Tardiphaga sp. OK245]SEH40730.1 hypothetical protein SAMN05216367_0066 [Tardiphaga sp. OK245]
MSSIEEIYQKIEFAGETALSNRNFDIDPIPTEGSSRWGISLIYRPKTLGRAVFAIGEQLKASIGPQSVLYNESNIHLTIRSIEGFSEETPRETIAAYAKSISQYKSVIREIEISFRGIAVTPSGVIVKGYPNESLQKLREAVFREIPGDSIKTKSGEDSIQNMRKTAHASLLVYEESPLDADKIKILAARWRETAFGMERVGDLEIVRYVRRPGSVQLVTLAEIS